jgi:hypothetical protein
MSCISKKIISIDPGWSGAMAVFENGFLKRTHKCQSTSRETYELIWKDLHEANIAILEWVHSMPGQGVVSTFKFGYNYGMWHGFLASALKETCLVSPQRWQKGFTDVPKVKKDRKKYFKQRAIELSEIAVNPDYNDMSYFYKKIKITNYNADAICIGQWYINKVQRRKNER